MKLLTLSLRGGFATPARHCQSLAGGKQSSYFFDKTGLPRPQSGARNDRKTNLFSLIPYRNRIGAENYGGSKKIIH